MPYVVCTTYVLITDDYDYERHVVVPAQILNCVDSRQVKYQTSGKVP